MIRSLLVRILGDSKQLDKELKKSEGMLGKFAKRGLQTIAALGAAALVAGAAIGGALATQGIKDAIQYQTEIAKVSTLLGDVTDKELAGLGAKLRDISVIVGSTSDTMSAAYQALSAGIQKDDLPQFLETMAKLAKAGFTDIETAVGGVAAVKNAYAGVFPELTADKIADIFLTTQNLGVTTVDELGRSIGNVTPIAASLGIKMEDVAAGLAQLTAVYGGKTAEATTQMRSLFVEASKGGTLLSNAIKDITGQSFQASIEEGKNFAEILNQVREAVGEAEFADLFGSVEAKMAALLTTGEGFDSFIEKQQAMVNSAGALDEAYATVSSTFAEWISQTKQAAKVRLLEGALVVLPQLQEALQGINIGEILNGEAVMGFQNAIIGAITAITNQITNSESTWNVTILPALATTWDWIKMAFEATASTFSLTILPILATAWAWIKYLFGEADIATKEVRISIGATLQKGMEWITQFFGGAALNEEAAVSFAAKVEAGGDTKMLEYLAGRGPTNAAEWVLNIMPHLDAAWEWIKDIADKAYAWTITVGASWITTGWEWLQEWWNGTTPTGDINAVVAADFKEGSNWLKTWVINKTPPTLEEVSASIAGAWATGSLWVKDWIAGTTTPGLPALQASIEGTWATASTWVKDWIAGTPPTTTGDINAVVDADFVDSSNWLKRWIVDGTPPTLNAVSVSLAAVWGTGSEWVTDGTGLDMAISLITRSSPGLVGRSIDSRV